MKEADFAHQCGKERLKTKCLDEGFAARTTVGPDIA